MNRKYYYLNENDTHHFLEVSLEKNEYLKFSKKKIKYRFLTEYSTEGMEELGYYAYKKLLDNEINRL